MPISGFCTHSLGWEDSFDNDVSIGQANKSSFVLNEMIVDLHFDCNAPSQANLCRWWRADAFEVGSRPLSRGAAGDWLRPITLQAWMVNETSRQAMERSGRI